MASVNGCYKSTIQRGIEQGDIHSTIIFDCFFDINFNERFIFLDRENTLFVHGNMRLSYI